MNLYARFSSLLDWDERLVYRAAYERNPEVYSGVRDRGFLIRWPRIANEGEYRYDWVRKAPDDGDFVCLAEVWVVGLAGLDESDEVELLLPREEYLQNPHQWVVRDIVLCVVDKEFPRSTRNVSAEAYRLISDTVDVISVAYSVTRK